MQVCLGVRSTDYLAAPAALSRPGARCSSETDITLVSAAAYSPWRKLRYGKLGIDP